MAKHKNSLSVLSENYKSDEEEENNYFEDKATSQESKNKFPSSKLPLPEILLNLSKSEDSEIVDIPELHDGRIRSFPHERGNWATYVFIPFGCSSLNFSLICNSLIETCNTVANFNNCTDFHISISRTVILNHHWIQPFVEDLGKKFQNLNSFQLHFGDLDVYSNDEKTRTFIGLKVKFGYDQLRNCVNRVDRSLLEFRLPPYYKNPSFHLSLLWCSEDKTEDMLSVLPKLRFQITELRNSELESWSVVNSNPKK